MTIEDTIEQTHYWLHLATFLHGPLKESLLVVLHNTSNENYVGLPTDPSDLYQTLKNTHHRKITQLSAKNVLNQEKLNLIFPPGDTKTYSAKFDITIIVVLIINCTTLTEPLNSWRDKNPPINDQSIAANVIRARKWRNHLCHHSDPTSIDENEFTQSWAEGVGIITAIGYTYDTEKLKNISLEPKHELVLKSLYTFLEKQGEKKGENSKSIDQLRKQLDQVGKQLHRLNSTKIKGELLCFDKSYIAYFFKASLGIHFHSYVLSERSLRHHRIVFRFAKSAYSNMIGCLKVRACTFDQSPLIFLTRDQRYIFPPTRGNQPSVRIKTLALSLFHSPECF